MLARHQRNRWLYRGRPTQSLARRSWCARRPGNKIGSEGPIPPGGRGCGRWARKRGGSGGEATDMNGLARKCENKNARGERAFFFPTLLGVAPRGERPA
eukprot:scaffold1734_cov113-Isochrysis_galbana.AAC.7